MQGTWPEAGTDRCAATKNNGRYIARELLRSSLAYLLLFLAAFLALLALHRRLREFAPLQELAALRLDENNSICHPLNLLATLALHQDRVSHLGLLRLLLLRLEPAAVLEVLELRDALLPSGVEELKLLGTVFDLAVGVLLPLFLLRLEVVHTLLQEVSAPFVDCMLHHLGIHEGLQLFVQLLLFLSVNLQKSLLLGAKLLLLKFEFDVADQFVLLKLLLKLFDLLRSRLRLALVLCQLALQVGL
mmetsp:Transcript_36573/g.55150  ORF Transcript_36573/g.55150 Transcript_36573/m.55150 type:complete len:245 (+) Transcript_36573:160-894(+)